MVAAVVLIAIGFGLADLGRIAVCDGPIVDAAPCNGARLRQSIFASALALAGIIAAAVLIAAFVVAHRPRPTSTATVVDEAPAERD
ncbi:hypothetical protein P5G50_04555 [Leifsonia sp. F6_8S_P_1B]|uniref:Uncharacterized protein n=1 Tax=Leifsonia williamsii TaxID=3035919 RepID=A0ABT8K9J4_9MICO|nr:hypothetical protein [Leifsonia williamsii]MDN4613717.1 hypothetical protein [Leifsonia williamsii]